MEDEFDDLCEFLATHLFYVWNGDSLGLSFSATINGRAPWASGLSWRIDDIDQRSIVFFFDHAIPFDDGRRFFLGDVV